MRYWVTNSNILSSVLYYPLWYCLTVGAFLYIVCIIFGMIPVFGLIRKTPSEILSKYDI